MILRNVEILVFSQSAGVSQTAEEAALDSRLSKARLHVHKGGAATAAQWLAAHRSPDILVVEDPMDGDFWERLDLLAEHVEPTCKVIVTGPKDSITLYRELIGRGLADYLGGGIGSHDLIAAFTRLFTGEVTLPKGRLVVVTSASGGAGGSTVAAILADELSRRFSDALLLDLDLNLGTAALALAVEVRDPVAEAVANPGLDVAMLERFVVREEQLRILSTQGSLRVANTFTTEQFERVVQVARTLAKVVVVDLPKGWGEPYHRILSSADEIAVVTVPELASFRNARMIVDDTMARRADPVRPKIILNKVGLAKGKEYSAQDFKEALGTAPTAVIPWDPIALMTAMANGRSITGAGGRAVPALKAAAQHFLVGKDAHHAPSAKPASNFDLKRLFLKHA